MAEKVLLRTMTLVWKNICMIRFEKGEKGDIKKLIIPLSLEEHRANWHIITVTKLALCWRVSHDRGRGTPRPAVHEHGLGRRKRARDGLRSENSTQRYGLLSGAGFCSISTDRLSNRGLHNIIVSRRWYPSTYLWSLEQKFLCDKDSSESAIIDDNQCWKQCMQ